LLTAAINRILAIAAYVSAIATIAETGIPMSYAERAFAGPDYWGRTFIADHCAHCATRDEHHRRKQIDAANRQVLRSLERRARAA
jgi:hypothetical protein